MYLSYPGTLCIFILVVYYYCDLFYALFLAMLDFLAMLNIMIVELYT